jgi:hypothetical protein
MPVTTGKSFVSMATVGTVVTPPTTTAPTVFITDTPVQHLQPLQQLQPFQQLQQLQQLQQPVQEPKHLESLTSINPEQHFSPVYSPGTNVLKTFYGHNLFMIIIS